MKKRITLHHNVPGLKKGEDYIIKQSHPDTVGGWDGYRTWMVHYEPVEEDDYDEWMSSALTPYPGERIILYIAMGNYFDIGRHPDDTSRFSRFEIAKLVIDLMESGVSPDLIHKAIKRITVK